MLDSIRIYDGIPTNGLKSARMQDVIKTIPKVKQKIRNPPLPANENVESHEEEFDCLEGQGVKFIILFHIKDIYTRLEVLLGLKISGHTNTLTEASNLVDALNKRGDIQNEQQYRNALDKFHTN